MARGITQEQVNEAADALLRAGERPTIERVRAALGTGSPNTLIRLLDTWWTGLGQRLVQHERRLALPEAPDSVSQAAGALWTLALEQAEKNVTAQFAQARAEFERSRTEGAQAITAAQDGEQRAHAIAADLERARDGVVARLHDLERLVDQQARQMEDQQAHRDAALAQTQLAQARVESLTAELHAAALAAAAERTRLSAHLQSTEDRWLQEVDRARQESARLGEQLRRHEHDSRTVTAERDRLRAELAGGERHHAIALAQLTRATAEVERLHRLLASANLAASSRKKAPPTKKVPAPKRQSRA